MKRDLTEEHHTETHSLYKLKWDTAFISWTFVNFETMWRTIMFLLQSFPCSATVKMYIGGGQKKRGNLKQECFRSIKETLHAFYILNLVALVKQPHKDPKTTTKHFFVLFNTKPKCFKSHKLSPRLHTSVRTIQCSKLTCLRCKTAATMYFK